VKNISSISLVEHNHGSPYPVEIVGKKLTTSVLGVAETEVSKYSTIATVDTGLGNFLGAVERDQLRQQKGASGKSRT
jgi:hypothetical protein